MQNREKALITIPEIPSNKNPNNAASNWKIIRGCRSPRLVHLALYKDVQFKGLSGAQ